MKPRVLLIMPPSASIEFQSLALHNLQACAREEGYKVDIKYLNISFFKKVGRFANEFCKMNYFLLGERLFAKAAWGDLVKDQFYENLYNYNTFYKRDINPIIFYPPSVDKPLSRFRETEQMALDWIKSLEDEFTNLNYTHVGITSSFEQTNGAIAILKLIKRLNPNITTFIGGFNCESELAEGISSLDPKSEFINYIFSGESEVTFIEFLKTFRDGQLPLNRIIKGKPLLDLNSIPNLDYSDYFNELKRYFPENFDSIPKQLVMETSRGCWWGEKSQCRFCGTSDRVIYREKSESRFINELEEGKKWGVTYLHMADLIMPESYLENVLDKISESNHGWKFYYEQKVNLSLQNMEKLLKAGITGVQPGIESLSSGILKKMAKGTTLKRNISFLRDASIVGLTLFWNIVWGIPGEKNSDYKDINNLIPLIMHLPPPLGIFHMTLVKFSPYYNNPLQFGIKNIKPIPSYSDVFPSYAEVDKLAIIYSCNYEYETIDNTVEIDNMIKLVGIWANSWNSEFTKPRLHICKQGDGQIVLLDTRGIEGLEIRQVLTDSQIKCLINSSVYSDSNEQNWALKNRLAILENKDFIPLPTIDSDIRREYEN